MSIEIGQILQYRNRVALSIELILRKSSLEMVNDAWDVLVLYAENSYPLSGITTLSTETLISSCYERII